MREIAILFTILLLFIAISLVFSFGVMFLAPTFFASALGWSFIATALTTISIFFYNFNDSEIADD